VLEEYARGDTPQASQVLLERVPHTLWPLLALLLGVFAIAVALSLLAQGSARLLPLQRQRRSFSRLPAPRTSKFLWCVLLSLLAVAALHEFVRVAPGTAGPAASRWLLRASALAALISVLDIVLARTAFLRSLWLTRREHLDDQREAYGSPEMRTARAQLRRETSQSSLEGRP
jgi:flagellar biosynthesis protein FlhB